MTKKLFTSVFVMTLFIFSLMYPTQCINGMTRGLNIITQKALPSLFPFMALSTLLINTIVMPEKIVDKPMRFLFNLPAAAFLPLFTGLLCGFPMGAKNTGELYLKGDLTKNEAKRLLFFCNNTGPSFVVGVVGIGIFSDARSGLLLYLSQLSAVLTLGVFSRFLFKTEKNEIKKTVVKTDNINFSSLFQHSIKSAVKSMAYVCGFILFFSFLNEMISLPLAKIFPSGTGSAVIASILEITTGMNFIQALPFKTGILTASAAIGWAGLSVHFQTAAVLSETGLELSSYFVGKIITSLLCVAFCLIFL